MAIESSINLHQPHKINNPQPSPELQTWEQMAVAYEDSVKSFYDYTPQVAELIQTLNALIATPDVYQLGEVEKQRQTATIKHRLTFVADLRKSTLLYEHLREVNKGSQRNDGLEVNQIGIFPIQVLYFILSCYTSLNVEELKQMMAISFNGDGFCLKVYHNNTSLLTTIQSLMELIVADINKGLISLFEENQNGNQNKLIPYFRFNHSISLDTNKVSNRYTPVIAHKLENQMKNEQDQAVLAHSNFLSYGTAGFLTYKSTVQNESKLILISMKKLINQTTGVRSIAELTVGELYNTVLVNFINLISDRVSDEAKVSFNGEKYMIECSTYLDTKLLIDLLKLALERVLPHYGISRKNMNLINYTPQDPINSDVMEINSSTDHYVFSYYDPREKDTFPLAVTIDPEPIYTKVSAHRRKQAEIIQKTALKDRQNTYAKMIQLHFSPDLLAALVALRNLNPEELTDNGED